MNKLLILISLLIPCQGFDFFNQEEISTGKTWSSELSFKRAHDSIKAELICPSPIIEEMIIVRGNTWGGAVVYRMAVCEEVAASGKTRQTYLSYHVIQNINRGERGPGGIFRLGPIQGKDPDRMLADSTKFVDENLLARPSSGVNENSRKQSLCLISVNDGNAIKQIGIINSGTEEQWLQIDKLCLVFLTKFREVLGTDTFNTILPREAK